MKKSIIGLSVLIALLSGIYGCKKYEQFPVDKVTKNYIFDPLDSAGTNAQSYLYGIYAAVQNGHNRVGGDYLDAASDDAVSSKTGLVPVTLMSTNGVSAATFPSSEDVWEGTNPAGAPNSYYAGIRLANEFITNIAVVPVKGSLPNGVGTRWVWKSEARFLRAYFYFELVKRYGGVPLLGDKVYNIKDVIALPRNKFSDCINYIVNECNAIKDSLITAPLSNPNDNFRVTKGAALALKARVLLYAASPLFNGGNIDPSNPLTGYTNSDINRWTLAANAAKDVIALNSYSLNPSFKNIFLTQNNSERIFIRPGGNSVSTETNNGPVGFQAASAVGNTNPTQELVNAFPMQNGLPITDPSSGYNSGDPYAVNATPKRDPRFAASIIYNGDTWLNASVQTFEGGQSKPNVNTQQTITGYYMRKFMGAFETTTAYSNHSSDWVIFRYAEILLSLAEAENEAAATPPSDCYTQIYAIRARAGIAPGAGSTYGVPQNMTTSQMRAFIQNEWRIEFAFEEHRYFDMKRWKIAETVMNQPRTGVSIVKTGATLTYNPINVLTTVFTTKQYLHPIPYNEILKNPNLKQNLGW
jgi:hypothetical protein